MSSKHRVVVIGSGFGGLFATKALRRISSDRRPSSTTWVPSP